MTTDNPNVQPNKHLSEKEMFALFAEETIVKRTNFGFDEHFVVSNYLYDGGMHDSLFDFVEQFNAELLTREDPSDELDGHIHDLEARAAALKAVLSEFRSFLDTHDVTPDDSGDERSFRAPYFSTKQISGGSIIKTVPDDEVLILAREASEENAELLKRLND